MVRRIRKKIHCVTHLFLRDTTLLRSAVCANAIVRCVRVCHNLGRAVTMRDIVICVIAISIDMALCQTAILVARLI